LGLDSGLEGVEEEGSGSSGQGAKRHEGNRGNAEVVLKGFKEKGVRRERRGEGVEGEVWE
jgi:hypothetical protein